MAYSGSGNPCDAPGCEYDGARDRGALQRLEESEERFRRLTEATFEGICIHRNGLVLDANERLAQMLGYELSEMVGRSIIEFLTPEFGRRALETMERGGTTVTEARLLRRDASSLEIEACAVDARLEGQRVRVVALRDISEQKRISAELERHRNNLEELVLRKTSELREANDRLRLEIEKKETAQKDLLRLNIELKGYAHTVSHELRNPLTGIQLAVDWLQHATDEYPPNDAAGLIREVRGTVRKVKEQVTRMRAHIRALLTLAESGQVPGEVLQVDVSGVVRRVLDELSADIEASGTRVEVDRNLGTVVANPTHLYQLFLNIIDNSVRHNGNRQPAIGVRLLGERGRAHRYLVSDNGPGFPPGDRDRIFLPFYRCSGCGSGIGLTTVSKIVRTYGGDIRAYNDGGACLEFTLNDYQAAGAPEAMPGLG